MDSERTPRANELFNEALKLEPVERAAYLAEACGGDENLRADVEGLLAVQDQVRGLELSDDQATSTEVVEPVVASSSSGLPNAAFPGYEIVRKLSAGGQGVVYQAIQTSTKRKVAIKVLLDGAYASKSAERRFEREIELVASLKHPNIISIFHSGKTPDGRPFCVMDYVRGVSLNQYVRDEKLTLEDALKLFGAVCEAVNYAHQKGVIHRDLKPSNILVDSEGAPKVLDFGLAKTVGGPEQTLISMTGQVMGTLPYMSPEQAQGNPDKIDIRTDVYALGVILYEMLTGQYPYPVVGQMADVLKHIAETEPTPPSRSWKCESGVTQRSKQKRLRAGDCPIDDEVQTIVLKTLSKERARRYQSAGELVKDVKHYLAGEPIEAKRDSGWYVVRKLLYNHRHRVYLYSALGCVLSVAVILVLSQRFVRYVELPPSKATILERRMESAMEEGHYEEAMGHARSILALENPDDFLRIGWDGRIFGSDDRERNHTRQYALRTIAWAHYLEGDLDKSLSVFRELHALPYIGRILLEQGRADEALQTLAGAGNGAFVWYNRGLALQELGRFDEAVAAFRRAVSDNRNVARFPYSNWAMNIWHSYGFVAYDFPSVHREGIEISVGSLLAYAQLRGRQPTEAIETAQHVIRSANAKVCDSLLVLAMAHQHLGNTDQAQTHYDRAKVLLSTTLQTDAELSARFEEAADTLGTPGSPP